MKQTKSSVTKYKKRKFTTSIQSFTI